ncbi:hypothetical protein V1Y59_18285 [Gordonia sp. PKS22-38]|uniref:Gll2284 protein n=1 Tax=Gordonia prachuapensis TaxID=3115651 RepID=A0ABU7MXH3_9ACTN|nr:hypothetical protein [Gordonia sp. PKS22-38]
MADLADDVLPLIRTRADLHTWRASNAHGAQMHEGVDLLREAAEHGDPAEAFAVTQRALASALKVVMRADDSSGIIGDAVRDLLDLHADLSGPAAPPPAKLVDWMIRFQFHNDCDFFTLDPVRYAPALGDVGMARYRRRLDEIRTGLGPLPDDWRTSFRHDLFTLDHNDCRLAVLDRDVDAVIRTHARDQGVAAWLDDTAKALAEIDEYDRAIDWAQRATEFDRGHQSLTASETWCALVAAHRPDELLATRLAVFRRFPSSSTAARLYDTAGDDWDSLQDEVTTTLDTRPRDAVVFSLNTLRDPRQAWAQAHDLSLTDGSLWLDLIKKYEKIDRLAVLGPLTDLVHAELETAGAGHYQAAARHLVRMRRLANGTDRAHEVDTFIVQLRDIHRNRPRLQQEFDRAGLP